MATLLELLKADPLYTPVIGVAKTVFAAQGLQFTITGTEHVPSDGPAVMMINHTGYMDFTYAGLAAWPAHRLVRFMAKEPIFDHKIAGPLMRGMRHISVDRSAGAASFREALKALKAGEIVGVFPEATISMSFEPKEFKSGGVRLAQLGRAPILPVAIWGSQRVWTKGQPKRLGRTKVPIHIAVGAPITVDRRDDAEQATTAVRDEITRLLHGLQAGYPPIPAAESHLIPARLGGSAPTPEQAAILEAKLRKGPK